MKFFSYEEYKLFESVNNLNTPLVGIIALRKKNSDYHRYFEQEEYFRTLCRIGQNNNLQVCIFSHNDINDDKTKINRASFLVDDKWVDMETQLPLVVYNRVKSTPLSFLKDLEDKGVKLFTQTEVVKLAGDKLKTQRFLESKNVKMPIAEKYSAGNLLKYLNYNESVILKPNFGSQGKGIIYIKYNSPGYTIKFEDKEITIEDSELEEKVNNIIDYFKLNKNNYIIQQFVNLKKYDDQVFDIRVLMQKDDTGKIKRTGMGARIGGHNRITANLHTGGNKLELSTILKELFNEDLEGPIANNLRDISRNVCDLIENEVGQLGELALDFLISEDGILYLIEINSRPGRSLFTILPEIRERAIERPILYMTYLTKS